MKNYRFYTKKILIFCLFTLTIALNQAKAGETSQGVWQAQITPYVWMSGLSGDVSATQAPPVFSVDKSFSEILENLNGAFFVTGLARKGDFVIVGDFNYVSTSETDPTTLVGPVDADVEQISGTLLAGTPLIDEPGAVLYALGGARAWHVDATLTAPNIPVTESDTWAFVDPVLALRGRLALTDTVSLTSYGDIGGFGAGSDFTWQAVAAVNYALSERTSVSTGYRHLSMDYQDGGQLLDIDLSGPVVGATIKF